MCNKSVEQRSLLLDGELIYVYSDGSVEWLPKTKNKKTVSGNKLFRSYGWKDNRGYKRVVINQKKYQIHRIIALAFCTRRYLDTDQVDHINRNRSDNSASNLRWVSQSENMANTQKVDESIQKYGVRYIEDPKAYRREYDRQRRGG